MILVEMKLNREIQKVLKSTGNNNLSDLIAEEKKKSNKEWLLPGFGLVLGLVWGFGS